MTTLEDDIRDFILKLLKPKLAFLLAAICLFVVFQGKEFIDAFSLPPKDAIITLFKNVFILLTFWFASNAIFYLSQLPKLRETLNKAEQILDVQAFYPINYPDLPEEIKYNVRGYVSKSIKQICEHGTPLIVCSDREHFDFYRNFAFKAEKIYGTATRSPFYYASEPDISNYIKFFRGRNVTRVTILDKNTVEQIIARNIYMIDKTLHQRNKIPEIEWYEKQFNEGHTHFWFLQELKNESLLTDIHDEQRYTNYAIYLFKRSNKILLNYFERTNNMGFFLLKCIPSGSFISSDKISLKINSFIEKLDTCTIEEDNGFYRNFQDMVKKNINFDEFKVKTMSFEYPVGTTVLTEIANLLSSKEITASSWDELFDVLNDGYYSGDFIKRFPLVS